MDGTFIPPLPRQFLSLKVILPRYPKLSAAQKANLRALGKSDDYLVLYGLKQDTK